MSRITERANQELGIRKGAVIGKSFLYQNQGNREIPAGILAGILEKRAEQIIWGGTKKFPICSVCFCRHKEGKRYCYHD